MAVIDDLFYIISKELKLFFTWLFLNEWKPDKFVYLEIKQYHVFTY